MKIAFLIGLILFGRNSFAHAEGNANGQSSPGHATYSVPVSPELQPYATYAIPNPQVFNSPSGVVVSYELPSQLVGRNSPPVVFRAQPSTYGTNHFELTGANGHCDCQKTGASTRCKVVFQNLHVDLASAAEQIKLSSFNSTEISARLQIARFFGGDPIGILEY